MNNATSRADDRSDPSSCAAWLDAHETSIQARRNEQRRRELTLAWARLLLFAMLLFVALGSGLSAAWRAAASAAAAVAFAACVRRHGRIRADRELADRELSIIEESRRRCGGHVVLIRTHERPHSPAAPLTPVLDDGPTWGLTPQEYDDLDLYAPPVGVFGLLNRSSTAFGADRLRAVLENPCLSIAHIAARQQAIQWLDRSPAARMRLMAACAVLRGRDAGLDKLVAALRDTAELPSRVSVWPMLAWSFVSAIAIPCLAVLAINGSLRAGIAALTLAAINALFYQTVRRPVSAMLAPWRETAATAGGVLEIVRQGAAVLPAETPLGRLGECYGAALDPQALPCLCRWLPWNETGGAMRDLLSAVLFYDLHVAVRIQRCVLRHRDALLAGARATADLEALCSLACFAWEQPVCCYAALTPAGSRLQVATTSPAPRRELIIRGGRHPLIEPGRVVANDLELNERTRTWIITGSNMAGKSTFLRMAGINTMLAQMGTAAFAESMTLTPLRLLTDLRARDNLAREESYFLAEVRQVRRMIAPPAADAPVFGLIDEPFRGTNSQERIAASIAVARHLIASAGFFLLATHEQQLTELACDGAENRHFQENLSEAGLVFDYSIRPGPATTRNALRVLEREQYPREITEEAKAWASRDAG